VRRRSFEPFHATPKAARKTASGFFWFQSQVFFGMPIRHSAVANIAGSVRSDVGHDAFAFVERVRGSAQCSKKFAQFRAIRLVRREKKLAPSDVQCVLFTCRNKLPAHCVVIGMRLGQASIRAFVNKQNCSKKDVLFGGMMCGGQSGERNVAGRIGAISCMRSPR
jgi:hypothetical protein